MKWGAPQDRADLNLLTAAPVSLVCLHLCCKGSCEFVESSLRTVLLRNPHRHSIFCRGNRPAAEFFLERKIFPESGMQTFVNEGEIDGGYRYLTKAWG